MFRHPLLKPVFMTQLIFNTAFFMLHAVYVPYAVYRLGLSAAQVGATLAAYGGGMVAGALLAPRITRALPFGIVIAIGPIAGLAAAAVMVLTIWTPSFLLAALSFFLIGAGPILWVISTTTLRQTVTPRDLLGRVSAINIMAYGVAADRRRHRRAGRRTVRSEICLIVAAIGFLIQALVILASPVVRLARQPAMAWQQQPARVSPAHDPEELQPFAEEIMRPLHEMASTAD